MLQQNAMHVQLKNNNGIVKEVKIGFSWTILLFGGLPFLFRGMPVWALSIFISSFFCCWIPSIIMAFIGNRITASYYLENGYKKIGSYWEFANLKWGMIGLPDNR